LAVQGVSGLFHKMAAALNQLYHLS